MTDPCDVETPPDLLGFLVVDGLGSRISYRPPRDPVSDAFAVHTMRAVGAPAAHALRVARLEAPAPPVALNQEQLSTVPTCSWPPPKPTDRWIRRVDLLERAAELGLCYDIVCKVLDEAKFPKYGVCQSKDLGFAIVTPLERIGEGGVPAPGAERFQLEKPGRFRCFVIGVTLPMEWQGEEGIRRYSDYDRFEDLLKGEICPQLSPEVRALRLGGSSHALHVYLYEFRRAKKQRYVHWVNPDDHPVGAVVCDHAHRAGFGAALGLPITETPP